MAPLALFLLNFGIFGCHLAAFKRVFPFFGVPFRTRGSDLFAPGALIRLRIFPLKGNLLPSSGFTVVWLGWPRFRAKRVSTFGICSPVPDVANTPCQDRLWRALISTLLVHALGAVPACHRTRQVGRPSDDCHLVLVEFVALFFVLFMRWYIDSFDIPSSSEPLLTLHFHRCFASGSLSRSCHYGPAGPPVAATTVRPAAFSTSNT